ncbi:MAG: SMP-30/gluconolactonase/LRE family protein [Phycisphaerae bacterium]
MRFANRNVGCQVLLAVIVSLTAGGVAFGGQPKVSPAQNEPDWSRILRQFGLDIDKDLRNPLLDGVTPSGLFGKADLGKPVVFTPIAAWGLETPTHAGWYPAGPTVTHVPPNVDRVRKEVWTYAYKQPSTEIEKSSYTPPPLKSGAVEFDPGDQPFGLWVSNEGFAGEAVYSQPALVFKTNARLRSQPYKAMIYPCCDAKAGRLVPDSYLIGWEYSTNDDFQDAVTRIDNVVLLPAVPLLKGVLVEDAKVRKLAGGFKFVEGPAWNLKDEALYFSDIPAAHIVRYIDGKTEVANAASGQSNGLMFDKHGMLIACEHAGRRLSRAVLGKPGEEIVSRFEGKRLNSPNDLWIDSEGGIYFTDPRYGPRDDLEQDKEAVYYVSADKKITRIIDDLVRPNGIALSPDGRFLYVLDNGADKLYRYEVRGPGRIDKGERIAYVTHPDGMTVDRQGRLYVAGRGGIWVLDAGGKWLGLIETPEQPSNCTFGGRGWHTLFITARTSLYAIDTLTQGWHVHLDGVPRK